VTVPGRTSLQTVWPDFTNAGTRALPTKPLDPVTRIFIAVLLDSFGATSKGLHSKRYATVAAGSSGWCIHSCFEFALRFFSDDDSIRTGVARGDFCLFAIL
jgi:hypothetical protein